MDLIKYSKTDKNIYEKEILNLLNSVFDETEENIKDNNEEICRIIIFNSGNCIAHGVGYIRQMNVDDYNFKAGIIGGIAVHKDYRNKGLAKTILNEIHNIFIEHKIIHSFLFANNPYVYFSSGYKLLENEMHIFDDLTQEWHIWKWPNSMYKNFSKTELPNGILDFNGRNY